MESLQDKKHLMIDIETLGDLIISIAAVQFDITNGNILKTFYKKIDLDSSVKLGYTIDHNVLSWWLNTNSNLLVETLKNGEDVIKVIDNFIRFFHLDCLMNDKNCYVWAKSPSYDCVHLKTLFKKTGFDCPWGFRNERDVRTFCDDNKYHTPIAFIGTAHDAFDDCKTQIVNVVNVFNINTNLVFRGEPEKNNKL